MENEDRPEISYEKAREIAEKAAAYVFEWMELRERNNLLDDRYLEAEHCWMFFRSQRIQIPRDQPHCDCAYVVSKRGNGHYVADLTDYPRRLRTHLQSMSNYFKDRNQ